MEQKIKVVCPTRGFIFAQTLLSLKENGLDFPEIVYGLPIPDGHNEGVKRVLKDPTVTHVLMIEDDMVIPAGAVEKMIAVGQPVVALDYAMDNGYSTITELDGKILWTGLGATLIQRWVFNSIEYPWFDNSKSVKILNEDPFRYEIIDTPNKYGGHDIMFGMKLLEKGIEIGRVDGMEAKHLRSDNIVRGENNSAKYIIKSLSPVSKRQQYRG